ncbi:MAG: hypothetical protein WD069_15715 [Planctomycetales bacterium]
MNRNPPAVRWIRSLATLSNLLFKAGIVAVLGTRRLLKLVALLFGGQVIAGALILWFW